MSYIVVTENKWCNFAKASYMDVNTRPDKVSTGIRGFS